MRRFWVLVLCLLLPLQGWAARYSPVPPCPMQDMMAMGAESGIPMDMLIEAMDDCCNDLDTFQRTGQLCKGVPMGATPVADISSFPTLAVTARLTQTPPEPRWRSLPPGATTRLWRPPSSL